MKKRVLFVGENPSAYTGNAHMMRALLSQVNTDKYDVACYVSIQVDPWQNDIFKPLPFTVITADGPSEDPWGGEKLLRLISNSRFDILIFVGIDIWRYAPFHKSIVSLKNQLKFKWVAILPYDLWDLRNDWANWFSDIDFPCIYSEYGYNMLKDHVPQSRYHRPPLDQWDKYIVYDKKRREQVRNFYFSTVSSDQFVFGFVGNNQIRKDPVKIIKAFEIVKKQLPNSILYLHTKLKDGVYNLKQVLADSSVLSTGDIVAKREGMIYTTEHVVDIYNCFDTLVNCSLQEGLSWTLVEAMLCGVPIIASDTTAQTELVKDVGVLVPCDQYASVPTLCREGNSWVDSKAVSEEKLADAMLYMATHSDFRKECIEKGLKKGKEWIDGVDDINKIFEEALVVSIVPRKKIPQILFAQHSSAGDVLMSTQCFKGIKENHPNMPFVYMTQKKFQGIVEGNPYISEIIDWDETKLKDYEILYNPHGDRILPGGWNNLDVKLADMYPYFCRVKADDMFIQEDFPGKDKIGVLFEEDSSNSDIYPLGDGVEWSGVKIKDFIIVHTTGGLGEFRTYRHMDIVLKGFDKPVVQIGAKTDLVCHSANIDLRGRLSWKESAWVMKRAKACIVIDSFPAHLAGVLGTPAVVLFGPAPARVTGPIGKGKIVCLESNKLDVCPITSHCWGNPAPGQQKCMSPCINTINPMQVRKALKEVLNEN